MVQNLPGSSHKSLIYWTPIVHCVVVLYVYIRKKWVLPEQFHIFCQRLLIFSPNCSIIVQVTADQETITYQKCPYPLTLFWQILIIQLIPTFSQLRYDSQKSLRVRITSKANFKMDIGPPLQALRFVQIGSILQTKLLNLTSKCFQSVKLTSFRTYRGGPMPTLQFTLQMILTLCARCRLNMLNPDVLEQRISLEYDQSCGLFRCRITICILQLVPACLQLFIQ